MDKKEERVGCCPLMSRPEGKDAVSLIYCQKEGCAWYVSLPADKGLCAIRALGLHVAGFSIQ